MLIRLTLENWMSFKNKVTFSMVASKEKQHSERLSLLTTYKTKVLPIAAIYGGNASGKTNFFKGLNFARHLIVRGTRPDALIMVDPFRLDSGSHELPCRFSFEILADETIYEYSFAVNHKQVLEEKPVKISSASEKVLFDRQGANPNFGNGHEKDDSLQFAFKGTRDNQLFITNSVSQKIDTFRPIYDWFKNTLEMVAPDSRFEPFEQFFDEGHPLHSTMNEMLSKLDTGIVRIGGDDIPFETLDIPAHLKAILKEEIKEGMTIKLDKTLVTRLKNGELVAKKLVAYHPTVDGPDAKFEFNQESDGSKRVIDLLPAFLELSSGKSKKVYVIDEVDRSLHSLLTRKLLEGYLGNCSQETRNQLLITTHDVLLMDQDLLRRDEMWVAERDNQGSSKLIPFSDYKDVRSDKDIRKSYLQGRLGGIPNILLGSAMLSKEKNTGTEGVR